jgi:hypothetical protein
VVSDMVSETRGRSSAPLVALDAQGREISRLPFETDTPGTYPCAKPVDFGAGMKACS